MRMRNAYGSLPLSFEENRGQTDARVRFLARGGGYALFLTSTDAVLEVAPAGAIAIEHEASGGGQDRGGRVSSGADEGVDGADPP